jgi:glycosyltransferase 2 family protein
MIEIDGLTKRSGDKTAVAGGSRPSARSPGLARQHDGGDVVLPPMTGSPSVQLADDPGARPRDRVLPATQYRHPVNVIRLMAAAGVLAAAAGTAALLPALLRPAAAVVLAVQPASPAGRVLTGLVQVVIAAAALVLLVAALRCRQSRVLGTAAAGFAAAAALTAGISYLAGPGGSAGLPGGLRQGSWLAGAGFPDPAVLAGLAAVAVVAAPWLSRPWRRGPWVVLLLAGAARLITGGLLPMQLVLALAAGITAGAGVLVVFGVPDRRMGPAGVAAALRAGGLAVREVTAPARDAKGSRPFQAATGDGGALFVKVFGSDQRNADLLYRAWRGIRLRGVGDTRPASSLFRAVEHEALLAVMAERAGVTVPHVGQVIKAADGSVLLTMELVAGQRLDDLPASRITDQLAGDLWAEVGRLHQAGIAHRSLHGGNIMISQDGHPVLTDFSFAELAATTRQRAIDVAELLTSLAGRIGPDRAVAAASAALGDGAVAAAAPLLQPLALSGGTRRATKGQDGLVKRTRSAVMAASGGDDDQGLARLQRVRPRTLLAIAALAGAFYFLLPQIAEVSGSWHALEHANWAWLPVIIGLSALTYVASAIALIGSVPGHVPFGPAVLAQGASSFINRVSPANVGGMALNARFLQKTGTGAPASVAAVGVNSLAGAVMHVLMIVVFFALAGHDLTKAFTLPSGSKILLILAGIIAVIGAALATRPGRRWTRKQLIPGARSAARSLQQAASSPVKLGLLLGGSALITLAYIAGLAASVQAFGAGPGLIVIGAVYLAAAALAAAAPTPGGLGAIEAALVAGLTGVGMQPGPAVSAVLLYRLATYWLPVAPGWLCWRSLQHRGYV